MSVLSQSVSHNARGCSAISTPCLFKVSEDSLLIWNICVWSLQNGNITELLLKEGFARCVDWSMAVYTQGAEKLRAAERSVLLSRPVVCPSLLYISNNPDISFAGSDREQLVKCFRLSPAALTSCFSRIV